MTLEDLAIRLDTLTAQVAELKALIPTQLVSIADAAKELAVSQATVRRQVKAGKLPSLRIGRQVRIDLSKVKAA